MDIIFYQMMTTSLEKTLPRLLEKVYNQNKKAVVIMDDVEQLKNMDNLLWTFGKLSFIPHGSSQKYCEFKNRHPIWLTLEEENPNEANVLVVTNNYFVQDKKHFERCLYVFDGQNMEKLKQAQEFLKHYQLLSFPCTWWLQKTDGKWENLVNIC